MKKEHVFIIYDQVQNLEALKSAIAKQASGIEHEIVLHPAPKTLAVEMGFTGHISEEKSWAIWLNTTEFRIQYIRVE